MAVKQVFNTSAELDFPNVLPTLDLDFANSKTLDPRITFTRASGGSYVGADGLIKYAGVNEARFDHDPSTGESLGLLIEESRSNLLIWSEDASQWGNGFGLNPTLTNQIIAPDGSLTADKQVENTENSQHFLSVVPNISYTNGVRYTRTVFLKAAERTIASVYLPLARFPSNNREVVFNLITGNIISSPSGVDALCIPYPNGWFKCSVSVTADSTGTGNGGGVALRNSNGGASYQGDGFSGVYVWGQQVEVGAFPTSYIPTLGSTRTRAADIASITGKNFSEWYRQIGYTIFSEHITARPSSVFPRVFNISTSTDSFRLNHYQPPQANYVGFSAVNNNINFADIRYFNITQSVKAKMATSYDFNNVVLYVNGDFVGRDITNPYPSQNRDRINIGSATPSGSYINSTISKITYYPYPLKDSNLQSLTS
jgi:hypothetical protein